MKNFNHQTVTNSLIYSLTLVSIIFFSIVANGQTKSESLSLVKGSLIRSIVKRGDSGFIMSSYQQNNYGMMKSTPTIINYFDNSLNKKWEYTADKEDFDYEDFFVANEATEYIYWMSSRFDKDNLDDRRSAARIISIQRFDGNGNVEQYKTRISEINKDVELLHVCADKDNLYYFSVKPAEYKKNKMVSTEELYLYTMPHNSKKFTKTTFDFELAFDDYFSSINAQLSFIGTDDSTFYVCQKRIAIETNKMEITVFAINKADGEFTKFMIEPVIENYYSQTVSSPNWDWNGDYNNNISYIFKNETITIKTNSLVSIYLDKKFQRFCVYAISSKDNDQYSQMCHPIQSIILQTYDLTGKKISASEFDIKGNDANNLLLAKKCHGNQKKLNFSIISKDVFRFDFHHNSGEISTYYLSQKKILSAMKTEKFFKGMKEFDPQCSIKDEMKLALLTDPQYDVKSYNTYVRKAASDPEEFIKYAALEFGSKVILFKTEITDKKTDIELMLFE